tara:strand:- start:59 stop:1168 length:1110 start_codon:yes stop_codon:yes gene_type:complete
MAFSNGLAASTSYANDAKNQPMLWQAKRDDSKVISNESVLGFDLSGQESVLEAFNKANCNFNIVRRDLYYMGQDGHVKIDDKQTLVREDTDIRLAEVSKTYRELQPASIIEFVRQLLSKYPQGKLTNLINFNNSKRMYGVVDLGTKEVTGPNDSISNRLHFFNSNDLSSGFGVFFTTMRLQCCNQMSSFTGRVFRDAKANQRGLSMKHTQGINSYVQALPAIINKETNQFNGVINDLKQLAKVELTKDRANKAIETLFAEKLATPIYDHSIKDKRDRTINDLKEVDQIRKHFRNGHAIQQTAFNDESTGEVVTPSNCYRFLNSITQFYSHDTGRAKSAIQRTEQRLNSLYHGDNGRAINKAREVLLNCV